MNITIDYFIEKESLITDFNFFLLSIQLDNNKKLKKTFKKSKKKK